VSPDVLRQFVFPWFKKYAALAHKHGKPFWYHCCGNVYDSGVIEDLIEDVRIDALHSFQDVIVPVTEFKTRYGDRLAALGGVDVDKLARLDDEPLRAYIRGILEHCLPGGGFALGSGNSVPNYIPLKNYLIMLEEGRRF
jgi:uroporphyrinogen decarboxylase